MPGQHPEAPSEDRRALDVVAGLHVVRRQHVRRHPGREGDGIEQPDVTAAVGFREQVTVRDDLHGSVPERAAVDAAPSRDPKRRGVQPEDRVGLAAVLVDHRGRDVEAVWAEREGAEEGQRHGDLRDPPRGQSDPFDRPPAAAVALLQRHVERSRACRGDIDRVRRDDPDRAEHGSEGLRDRRDRRRR